MLARLQLTPYKFRIFGAYYLTFIGLGLVSASLGTAMPFLAEKLQIDLAVASNIVVAKSLGFMIGSFFVGRLFDRARPHGLVQIALLGASLTTIAIPAAPEFWILVIVLFWAGVFVGSADIGGNILIVWVFRSGVGPWLTGLHCIWGVGALISPLIIVYFHELTGNLLIPFLILGVLIFLCIVLYVRLPGPQPVHSAEERRLPIPPLPMATMVILLFLAGTLEVTIAVWIFSYIRELQMASTQVAGWINSSFFAAITLSRLLIAFILVRVSNETVLYVAMVLLMVAFAGIILFPTSLPLLWIGVVAAGAGIATLFPGVLTLAPEYLPAEGRVTSWMFAGASLGFLAAPWVTGQLFTRVGPHVIWYFAITATVLSVACLAMLHFLPRRLEQIPASSAA